MKMQEGTIAPLDPIEGSDDLDMMTISVNFEGSFAQFVKFVNLLDRSPRFLIIESMQAAPQPKGDVLNVNLKLHVFVKETAWRVRYEDGRRAEETRDPRVLLVVGGVILYFNVFAGDSAPNDRRPVAADPRRRSCTAPLAAPRRAAAASDAGLRTTASSRRFKLRAGRRARRGRQPDPATIDPTLRLDLLAKVQNVELPASMRNIFQYGAAPPPPAREAGRLPKNMPKIADQSPSAPPKPPGPPPARRPRPRRRP